MPTNAIYDDEIFEVTITRGKSQRGGGIHPTTLEISTNGNRPIDVQGHNCRFFIRDAIAPTFAAALGHGDWENMWLRFQGRAGTTEIEDNPHGIPFITNFQAASWIGQLAYSGKGHVASAGDSVRDVLIGLAGADNGLRGLDIAYRGNFPNVSPEGNGFYICKDDLMKWSGDLGYWFRENRDGTTDVINPQWRNARALDDLDLMLPLTRSQAISPATIRLNNEFPAAKIVTQLYSPTNQTTWAYEVNDDTRLKETIDQDWNHVEYVGDWSGNALQREIIGKAFETSNHYWTMPTLTVDLLMLMQGNDPHKRQAAQLLELEAAHPIYFTQDWPSHLRGIHFAEQIVERITPDSWTMELLLLPYSHVTGEKYQVAVAPKTWDSAGTNQWNNDTRTWNGAY
ncbi:hypothetical protein [Zhihengliuella halotolerans]|uniref:hypothetical protein n=1 Tax=Zhihengliuella halotolerans TaxID=370736 RepID=UPI00102B9F31|nr:hypothetical protein [Zhihengliuella halotolerans]